MATTAMSPIEKQREQLEKSMLPKTREVAVKYHDIFRKANGTIVLAHYDLGEELNKMAGNESTYGTKHVEQLAKYFNMPSAEFLYAIKRIADTFEREAIKRYCEQPMRTGGYLTIGHWREIEQFETDEDREKMLKIVIREGLTADEVAELRKAQTPAGRMRKAGAGRPLKAPVSPIQGLQVFLQMTRKMHAYASKVAVSKICKPLNVLASDRINEALIDRLSATVDELEELQKANLEVQDQLREALTRSKRLVKEHAADAEKNAEKNGEANGKAHAKEEAAPAKDKTKAKAEPVKTAARADKTKAGKGKK